MSEPESASAPRFEFRSFGRSFDDAAARMAKLSEPVPDSLRDRESEEIYILSRLDDVKNAKIRDGKLEIKTLLQTVDGLEQWSALLKAEFPLRADVLRDELFPALGARVPRLDGQTYTVDELLGLVGSDPSLRAVRERKRRSGYRVKGTLCEVARVLVEGAQVVTVSSESTEIEAVQQTIADLGLSGVENISYPQAIKRIIGMVDTPLAH